MLKTLLNPKLLVGAVLYFACVIPAKAQTNPITDAYAKVDASTGAHLKAVFFIEIADTNDVAQVEIKLGSAEGQNDLVSHIFDFDETSGLPAGFSYLRSGSKVTVGTNDFTDMSTYFGAVRVKSAGGSWSDPYTFITN